MTPFALLPLRAGPNGYPLDRHACWAAPCATCGRRCTQWDWQGWAECAPCATRGWAQYHRSNELLSAMERRDTPAFAAAIFTFIGGMAPAQPKGE